MSNPNLTNNLIQHQNIVLNQVPLTHTIMTNVSANNGIPVATALHANTGVDHQQQQQQQIQSNNINMQQAAPLNKLVQHQHHPQNSSNSDSVQVLTKQRLQDLVRETDSTLNLEEEVEEIILGYVDEFIDNCLNGASLIAKNRRNTSIEVKDVQQFLNRNYNMWTPGFGTDELRPYKRSMITEAHKARTALIRKALKKY